MKKIFFIPFLLSLVNNVFAETSKELLWMSDTKNIPPIKLSLEHTNSANLTYSYKENCSDQKSESESSSDGVFDCSIDDRTNELTITLRDGAAGKGNIEIQIIGVDINKKAIEHKTINYKVTVFNHHQLALTDCPSWNCNLNNSFYMGYEGTSVSDVNEKGNIRFQYSAYAQFSPLDHLGLHVLGDLMQTSQQEQIAAKSECQNKSSSENADETISTCEVEPTIAGNIGLFAPISFKPNDTPRNIIMGPMVEYSIRKLESSDEFVPSYYLNLRFAYNKIRFFSLGYGKSEGIPGGRIKINGQIPIYDEKLLAGFTLNMAADNEAKQRGLNPGDSINIYILTEVDFLKVFSNFKK